MSYVPDLVALYEIIPYIRNLPLNNETIRFAVEDYIEGGERKDAIVKMYGPIGYWNTSEVTDMSRLFGDYLYKFSEFNEDISKWDTSKVDTMQVMFYGASNFNQPIGQWDTSNVTDMKGMFWCAEKFNQAIGEWDTSSVSVTSYMFYGAKRFNKSIVEWNTSSVTDMEKMFLEAENFNHENAPWYHE